MQINVIYHISALLSRCIATVAAVVSLTVTCGCHSDVAVDPTCIPVRVSACCDVPSRATEPLDGSLYRVWASAIYTSDSQSEKYFKSDFSLLNYDITSNSYVASGYYYPLNGNLKFLAVAVNSPSIDANATITYSRNSSTNVMGYDVLTVDITQSDGTSEVIYSDVSTTQCPVNSTNPLQLHFHRPFAALTFNFIPADAASCSQIVINRIVIPDVAWQAKYTVTYNSYQTAGSLSWSNQQSPKTRTLEFADDQRMAWDADADKAMPLSQSLYLVRSVAKRPQIIIYYTVYNGMAHPGGVGDDDDNVRHLRYIIPADDSAGWSLNTQYRYNITVYGNSEMDFDKVEVLKVGEGTTGNMNI